MNFIFFILIGFVLSVFENNACQRDPSTPSTGRNPVAVVNKRVQQIKEAAKQDPDMNVHYHAQERKSRIQRNNP